MLQKLHSLPQEIKGISSSIGKRFKQGLRPDYFLNHPPGPRPDTPKREKTQNAVRDSDIPKTVCRQGFEPGFQTDEGIYISGTFYADNSFANDPIHSSKKNEPKEKKSNARLQLFVHDNHCSSCDIYYIGL